MSIYFLRYDGLIKIGFSSNLPKRVSALIAAIPGQVEFIGHMPGDRAVEAHLHSRFAGCRFSGEWFVATHGLEQLAATLLTPGLPAAEITATVRRRDDDDAWREMQSRVRQHASLLWPAQNHGERKALLAETLGWAPRRARSLYDEQSGQTLRQTEREQLDELFFVRGRALSDAAQQIEASDEPEPKGDDE